MEVKHLFSAVVVTFAVSSTFFWGKDAAVAATFSFSYSFLSGQSISGTVDGDLQLDNNTVRNLSNLSATYSGRPETVLQFLRTENFITISGAPGTSQGPDSFRFYGFADNADTSTAQPNFGFFLGGSPSTLNGATVGTFVTQGGSTGFPFGPAQQEAEVFSPARWTVASPSIPEPSTLLGLPGLAVVGGVALMLRQLRRTTGHISKN